MTKPTRKTKKPRVRKSIAKSPWRIWWGTPVVYSVDAPEYGSTVVYPQPRRK